MTVQLPVKTDKRSYSTFWSHLCYSNLSSPYMLANENLMWALLAAEGGPPVSTGGEWRKETSATGFFGLAGKTQDGDSKAFDPCVWGWRGILTLRILAASSQIEQNLQPWGFLDMLKCGNGYFKYCVFPMWKSLLHLQSVIKELHFYQTENIGKHLSVLMLSCLH